MEQWLPVKLSRLAVVGLAAAALTGGLAYSRLLRILAVPDGMRYVPEENGALLASGDVYSLYKAIVDHFPEAMDKGDSPKSQRGKLLADSGIDERRGVLISVPSIFEKLNPLMWKKGLHFNKESLAKKPFLAVVPLVNQGTFLKSMAKECSDLEPARIEGAARGFATHCSDLSLLLVLPNASTAVISNSRPLLERGLLRQRANLAHARNDDALYSALQTYLQRPLLSGPSVLVAESQDPAMLRRLDTVFGFGETSIDITSHLEFANRQMAVLENVFRPAPAPYAWAASLPYDTPAALTLQDDALARYLRFLAQFEDTRQGMQQWYGGILWQVQTASRLRRVTLAVTRYRDGLPDLLVGLWGDPSEIEGVFGRMRADFEKSRAQALAGKQTGSLQEAKPGQADEVRHGGKAIRFLTPKLTADDLRLRPEFEGLSAAALTGDRYRLAYVSSKGVCWVATEVNDLEQLLDRERPDAANLAENPVYRAASSQWTNREKLQFYLNLDQAMVLGLLNPESHFGAWLTNNLKPLGDHPVISMELACTARNQAQLHVRLRKRLVDPE